MALELYGTVMCYKQLEVVSWKEQALLLMEQPGPSVPLGTVLEMQSGLSVMLLEMQPGLSVVLLEMPPGLSVVSLEMPPGLSVMSLEMQAKAFVIVLALLGNAVKI